MQDASFWLPSAASRDCGNLLQCVGPDQDPGQVIRPTSARSEDTTLFTNLKLISFLQLVGVLVLAVVHLLPLDVGIHPVLLHVGSEEVKGVDKGLSLSVWVCSP